MAPLAWPLFTGRVFAMLDLANFSLPMRGLYQEGLRNGYLPIWTPSLFAGFYAHAEGQTGMFHPLHLLLYGTLPLQVAFNVELLVNYVAAFFGMFWFLRRLRLGAAASLFGASLFAFSGFQLFHFLHVNLVAGSAHMPWLLASMDLILVEERPARRALGMVTLACCLASQILVGFPQAVWWSLLAMAAFAALRAIQTGKVARLVPCALAVMCGTLIGGVQVLPTAALVPLTSRGGDFRALATTYSLTPYNVLQFWSPYVFQGRIDGGNTPWYPWTHEYAIYSGAILIVALPWLWIRRAALRSRRALIVGGAAFAVVTFVLALGEYGYVDLALTYLPVVGAFRAPCRYILLTQLALAVLATIAFDDLASLPCGIRLGARHLALLCGPLALSALTTALLNTHVVAFHRLRFAPPAIALCGTAIVAAVTGALVIAATGRRWGLVLLAGLTAADLGISAFTYVFEIPPSTIESLMELVPPAQDPPARVVVPAAWHDRVLLKGYRMAGGYAGLFPATALPFDGETFQRLASVAGSFGPDFVFVPWSDSMARARLLTDVRPSSNPAVDIATIDVHRTALVAGRLPALSGEPGSATVAVDRPGRIAVDTVAPGPQLLSISERFDEGWKAREDGRAIPLFRINGDFLGCVVDPGKHRIELRFSPRNLFAGALVSVFGLLLLAVAAVVVGRRVRGG